MKRRPLTPFSLSFLDIMFCGFGAVVLLVLILNHDTVKVRQETFSDLRSEVVKLKREVLSGRRELVERRNSLEASERELVQTRGEAERVIEAIRKAKVEMARLQEQTLARREHIRSLQSDLRSLDEKKKRLGAQAPGRSGQGEQVRRRVGEGDRQYLTGLKVGGRRVLILVDASASMLDETLVDVIRRRNLDDSVKRNAPKWKRALAISAWLVSNLPPGARFQLYAFNTRAEALLPGSQGRWLDTDKVEQLDGALAALGKRVPAGGTSLYRAFEVAKTLSPRPDNILLITDGLPTQGRKRPGATTVTPEKRLAHFRAALKVLPKGVPVNTLLLPMEGDAWAAAAYWRLAIDTRGAFLTPARDWP
ncbi:MAG TPA: VWA domain-containing protein [Gammaproteobacteria bacterium]|nr:VWA domain-containing protein [Gammaproteobacteria bacterium]